uniref:Uncharacterized protein n=1 Tax=Anguilla anguilla TaxID=7936 RepID=A0A0E9R5T5_ANGAN
MHAANGKIPDTVTFFYRHISTAGTFPRN